MNLGVLGFWGFGVLGMWWREQEGEICARLSCLPLSPSPLSAPCRPACSPFLLCPCADVHEPPQQQPRLCLCSVSTASSIKRQKPVFLEGTGSPSLFSDLTLCGACNQLRSCCAAPGLAPPLPLPLSLFFSLSHVVCFLSPLSSASFPACNDTRRNWFVEKDDIVMQMVSIATPLLHSQACLLLDLSNSFKMPALDVTL